jgi:hypothetical protein
MPFEFRIAVEADEPGRTVSVSIDEPMERSPLSSG